VQVNTTQLKDLLYKMKLIRCTEETIAEKYSENKMRCPTHLCTGQEAVAAGVGLALKIDDYAVSSHRAHGHYLGKGGSLPRMLAEIYGKETGCCHGKGGSMHLIDQSVGFMGSTAIVGNTIPVGAGLGLSIQLDGTDQVSCIFLGDGAVEEGVFAETVNFCAQRHLPVLFVCENNFYSVYSPLSVRQPLNRSISKMVAVMGIPSQVGDGNNSIDVFSLASEAIDCIRAGKGPQFIEFTTYRWREHCGPNYDNHIGYRTEDEYRTWKAKDPIPSLEKKMLAKKIIILEEISKMDQLIEQTVTDAFNFAEESAFPFPDEAYQDVFASGVT
jgi:TPP-dependent pyruvate/acetoin dehydrogenase alpha subunit